MYAHVEISQVVFMRHGTDTWHTGFDFSLWPTNMTDTAIPYGSAMSLSVSLTILFGNAMSVVSGYDLLFLGETTSWWLVCAVAECVG